MALTLEDKCQRLIAIEDELQALLVEANEKGLADLEEDTAKQYDELKAEHELLDRGVKREEELSARVAEGRQSATPPNKPNPEDVGEPEEDKNPWRSFGEQLSAVREAGSPGGRVDPRLTTRAATGSSEGVASDGGFLVQKDYVTTLLQKTWETGILAPKCRKITIGPNSNGVKIPYVKETSRVDGSRWGGVRAYWKDEAAAKTKSKPELGEIELNLQKLVCLWYATDELLQDATAMESLANEVFPAEINFKLDDGIINGTGAGQIQGILNATALVSVAAEGGQAATTIIAENVEKMYARMWAKSLGSAEWYINQDCWPQLFQLHHVVGTSGVPMFMLPGSGMVDAPFGRLLGRPVNPIEQCQTLGTKGDIYFADLNEFLLIDKGGIDSASSIHVQFIYDETVFRFVYRVNGQCAWPAALTPYKGSNTQSPIVTLAAR